ncbi:MAG TPA: adenylate/guanylate cyclase domain-containing protein [Candidatus Dormibacteraeota bacterium]|nr:adenylate/guanylate cyclase domain-containing protein [Candidatus Dormibacteraeota bacterium]
MPRLQAKSFAAPDDVRSMPSMRIETVSLDEARVGLCRFEPGWRWSTDVGPVMGATSCPIRHVGYCLSGAIRVVMDDGQTLDIGPNTVFEIPSGHDKWVVSDEPWVTLDWGGSTRAMEATLADGANRTLATVMFTDIVSSTATLERIGHAAWQDLLAAHNARLRAELNNFRGREVQTTGDGFLAVFDGATRAVRCAASMVDAAGRMDLPIRIGINTGEIEIVGTDVRGMAVHTAARLLALAAPNEILLSPTTRDLLDDPSLVTEDAGTHELKGLTGARQVYRLVRTVAAGPTS